MLNRAQLSKDRKASKAPKKLRKPKDIDYNSKMGYRDDSPFNTEPFQNINTPTGVIDMSNTGTPLMANGRYLPAYSGMHQFQPGVVHEIPASNWLDGYKSGGTIIDRLGRKHSIKSYVPWAQDGGPTFTGATNAEDSSLVRTYFNRAFNRPQSSEERYMELKRAVDDKSIDLLQPDVKRQALIEFHALEDAFKQRKLKKQNGGWLGDYNK